MVKRDRRRVREGFTEGKRRRRSKRFTECLAMKDSKVAEPCDERSECDSERTDKRKQFFSFFRLTHLLPGKETQAVALLGVGGRVSYTHEVALFERPGDIELGKGGSSTPLDAIVPCVLVWGGRGGGGGGWGRAKGCVRA